MNCTVLEGLWRAVTWTPPSCEALAVAAFWKAPLLPASSHPSCLWLPPPSLIIDPQILACKGHDSHGAWPHPFHAMDVSLFIGKNRGVDVCHPTPLADSAFSKPYPILLPMGSAGLWDLPWVRQPCSRRCLQMPKQGQKTWSQSSRGLWEEGLQGE